MIDASCKLGSIAKLKFRLSSSVDNVLCTASVDGCLNLLASEAQTRERLGKLTLQLHTELL